MDRIYPDGAFKSFDEFSEHVNRSLLGDAYSASRKFKMVKRHSMLIITVAHLRDSNIPSNCYNDWFLFANEADAKAYAGLK